MMKTTIAGSPKMAMDHRKVAGCGDASCTICYETVIESQPGLIHLKKKLGGDTNDAEQDPSRSITGVDDGGTTAGPTGSGDGLAKAEKKDMVYRPAHYTQYKQEPFTFFFLNQLPFDVASVCKYVLRYKQKNGVEDLRKAKRIIDMMIEMIENEDKYIAEKTCL